jgi:hypothetical protein
VALRACSWQGHPVQQAGHTNFDARMVARWFWRIKRLCERRIVTPETSYFVEDARMPRFFLACPVPSL